MKRSNIITISIVLILICSGFVIKGSINSGTRNNNIGLNIGDTAPEIVQAGVDGKDIKLSSLKNKIVLIDFWASWCRPCRMENPNVVNAYNEFKNKKFKGGKKGFAIFSVSLDQNADSWKQAIAQDGLIWKEHTSDLKGWANAVAKTYQISSIPNNYLIDGKGVIIAKNLRGENLGAELTKLLQ
jgi:thiol-disulfide isomerase/thioredoxin